MQSLDFLRKDLIETFYYTNMFEDRSTEIKEVVNGREVVIKGQACATTLIGLLYHVYDPSVKSYKYILHIGVAHQNPADKYPDVDEEYEKAYENALAKPVMQYVIGEDRSAFDQQAFLYITGMIKATQPKELVITDDELSAIQQYDKYGQKYPLDYLYFNIYGMH